MRYLGVWLFCLVVSAQPGLIKTIAGVGVRGFEGDGGGALSAALALSNVLNDCDPGQFEQASHIAIDSNGNLFLADSRNQRVRRVAPNGVISTVAGSGETPGVNARCEPTGSIADGTALEARFYHPSAVLPLPNGNLIIADQWNNRIRQLTPAGLVSTIAGSGQHNIYAPGVPALASPMDWPTALAVDAKGLIYFAELHGNRIGRIDADGRLATVAGIGFPSFLGDGGPANRAALNRPVSLGFDADGNLYIADTGNHRIRKVSTSGVISTLAGNGRPGSCGDNGPAKDACLNTPMDVKADRLGNIYIADTRNHRVRRIDADGIITTVAGNGEPGKGEEQISPLESALDSPSSLAIDANNNVFVLDWQNYRIRRIDFTGQVPAVTSVVNTANLTAPVAPGSLISIFGTSLANGLGETTATLNTTPLTILAINAERIDALLPENIALGEQALTITAGPYTSQPRAVEIVTAAPGLFPDALNEDGSVNSASKRSAAGAVVTCLATGLGAQPTVIARIGERDAEVIAVEPDRQGIVRITFRIPNGAPDSDAAPLTIEVNGSKSNTIPVAVGS